MKTGQISTAEAQAQPQQQQQQTAAPPAPGPQRAAADATPTKQADWPADVAELLGKVEQILQNEGPEKALQALTAGARSAAGGAGGMWLTNARGVCLLRLGEVQQALDLFRGLVLGGPGFSLRDDVPARFKTNYATAQLLSENNSGWVITLSQVRDESNPSVRRLRESIRRWSRGLSFWTRLRWHLGADVGPVVLDFPPGEL